MALRHALFMVHVVVAATALAACTRALDPVDTSGVLIACDAAREVAGEETLATCNEDIVVAAADMPRFGDPRTVIAAVVRGMSASPDHAIVDATAGTITIQGEALPASSVRVRSGETEMRGGVVARGGRLSLCLAQTTRSDADAACLVAHAAVLRGGRDFVRGLSSSPASSSLPPPPVAPGTCAPADTSMRDDVRGLYGVDCPGDVRVRSVRATTDLKRALDDALDLEAAADRAAHLARIETVRGSCDFAGTRVDCARIVDEKGALFAAAVQTRAGRRLITCDGTDANETPKLCPFHVVDGGRIERTVTEIDDHGGVHSATTITP